ncbi:unnamed protein product [Musa acuminata subsp. burmannicoides]
MGHAHCQVRRGVQPPFPPHPASPDPPQLPQPRLRQQGRPSRRPLARELLLGRLSPLHNREFDDGIWMCVWQGMLTGLLGNMTLLSYFAKKKEVEAIVVQTLGVVSIYVVLGQLAMAEAMSLPYFAAISVLVVSGLVLNFVNYFGWLHEGLWQLWEDFITVAGISVLPQVMWSTFVPFIPKSILPGTICCIIAVGAIILAHLGKLSDRMVKFIRSISGWTATLLFMWMPIAQMWTTYLNPDNIKGLSAFTILLGMIGNGLMIPRALFIRDLMWFTGASWASFLHGWGNLACMYYFKSISWKFFLGATLSLFIWTGIALWRDTKAYGYSSPMISLQELVSGT